MKDRSTVDEIKARLGIEEVISSYMKLTKADSRGNSKGLCPFHNEKTPSFYVSSERNSFYCFGCNEKGDIFSFVQKFEGLDFMGSLKLLAERAGVPLTFGSGQRENRSEKERLYAVMEAACIFYQSSLSGEALEYIKKRGVSDETLKLFRIGWAPEGWRNLRDHLAKKGFADADMEKAGLTKNTGDGKGSYDRFRGRVMFPIMDSSGRVIAFSGRLLREKEGEGKYINTTETPLYDKSAVLYGIDKAKADIRKRDYTILVEGQMDLIMSHQAGIKNTVAASGTALAEDAISREQVTNNLGIIRRLSPNLLIAFDSDAAGRKAALRAARIGLNLGMDVKVADIQGGKDPADLVLANPDDWRNTLRMSKPVIEFVLDGVMREGHDARKLPAVIRERALPFIAEVSGAMERSHWIKMIHDKTGLAEESIREDLKTLIANKQVASNNQDTRDNNQVKTGVSNTIRLDAISRKLFGILAYLERHPDRAPNVSVEELRAKVKSIAGADYDRISAELAPFADELAFEVEATYSETTNLKSELEELAHNFEEDTIKARLTAAMADLAAAERTKDAQKSNATMLQVNDLSKKLAELGKRKPQ